MWQPITLEQVSEEIVKGNDWKLWVFQFVDDFRRRPLVENIAKPPHHKLEKRFKAMLQSIALTLVRDNNLAIPNWCRKDYALKYPWFVSSMKSFMAMTIRDCPLEFKINNVFVSEDFMKRV